MISQNTVRFPADLAYSLLLTGSCASLMFAQFSVLFSADLTRRQSLAGSRSSPVFAQTAVFLIADLAYGTMQAVRLTALVLLYRRKTFCNSSAAETALFLYPPRHTGRILPIQCNRVFMFRTCSC